MELTEILKNIKSIDNNARNQAEQRWLSLMKPLFALGRLEDAITQIAGISGNPMFSIDNRTLVLMCADNGVVKEGVSQCGSEVTATVAKSFTENKTTVCYMAKKAGVKILPVDIGMNTDVEGTLKVKKLYGTNNIAEGAAMSREDCIHAVRMGIGIARNLKNAGCDIILTGEMGIGNTTTSSAIVSVLLDKNPEEVTGRGAGLNDEGLERKIFVIKRAIEINKPDKNDPIDVLSKLGGLDIAGITGLFIGGALYSVPVVIDGIISSTAALLAVKLDERIKDFIIPSHLSDEPAAKMLLDAMELKPFINCGMFVGEGCGAVSLMPLLDMALEAYKNLDTFTNWEHEAYKPMR